ncbi:hypothetical protein BEN47_12800 [Hymenobacter lapidarius]|uniref:SbsA Ig-like domain-containing protein n=1 Tax=Hymenobacter lapidarius TaxID=1908237 RepID=A0A1G1T6L9_9BACT|nr:FG-GAP-like repeat-containing protein [Hymenobacter lapidarius]OGX86530.1 hypothetical protein BEN47_12800 [Hymenobacter lapidarius]
MRHSYRCLYQVFCTALLLAPPSVALAQAPVITSIIPMANARAAARNTPLTVSFSQPLAAASVGALKVFSSQRGGLRTRGATPAVVSGNALSFAPTAYDFRPGETVQYTVTTAAASSGGALAQGRVGQFTAAVGGTGAGTFASSFQVTNASGNAIYDSVVGDIDGDGDLDLVTANFSSGTLGIRLNTGMGLLGNMQNIRPNIGNAASIAMGDVDGDGDLDMVVGNFFFSEASVLVNNGLGAFISGQPFLTSGGDVKSVALGDMDGDGDLDLLTSGNSGSGIQLNNGAGFFASPVNIPTARFAVDIATGDLDGDGDLDLLTANGFGGGIAGTVSIRLNNGFGTFSGAVDLPVGQDPQKVALGDVDGDGDLDLLVANSFSRTVSIRLNDGSGTFTGNQDVSTNGATGLVVGDVDGDGDLDLLAGEGSPLSIRLNDGSGTFGGSQSVNIGRGIGNGNLVQGDLDGDGDLDFIIIDSFSNSTIGVYLNGGIGPLATTAGHSPAALTLSPNPAHGAATLTGAAPKAPLAVLDALGRVLLTATADAAGTARLALPEGLPAGVYVVRCGEAVRRLAVE